MTDTPEQAELRRHLSELRQAAHGIGRDFRLEFASLDDKISRMPASAGKELRYFFEDVDDDFVRIGKALDHELMSVPGHLQNAGSAIAAAAVRVGEATRGALENAGHATREKGKDALARAAGVKRHPMKEWRKPSGTERQRED
ncbi:MAG: hypothetical protein L3K17_02110 [Thermoplasmata archaeon]|nr:hypothetical protein [Thermoplasmata archaeon]